MMKMRAGNPIRKVFLKILGICLICFGVYLYLDAQVSQESLISYASEVDKVIVNSKIDFAVAFQNKYIDTEISELDPKSDYSKWAGNLNIDPDIFDETVIRLNTEIYATAASVINSEHLEQCYGDPGTKLFASFKALLNPLIPLGFSLNEAGIWKNPRYTWTPAVYSQPLIEKGVDISKLSIREVNTDTYITNGLDEYLKCGNNCTAPLDRGHRHVGGNKNDNDSLGPLQILRRYVEQNSGIFYSCGAQVVDLMVWEENINYFFHNQGTEFAKETHWNKDYEMKNVYELVALMAVAHNSGNSFQYSGNLTKPISKWKNSNAVYDLCAFITSDNSLMIMQKFVDKWYEHFIKGLPGKQELYMAGECGFDSAELKGLISEMGLDIPSYTVNGEYSHKQLYPIKAVLNYMALEKLYTSGDD